MYRRRTHCVSIMLGGLLCASSVVRADENQLWPGWLGPDRTGWVADFVPPDQWPTKLSKRWQMTVGTGYGSPLVEGNRVFQHARVGDDEVVWCLDLQTGETIWRSSYEAPFKIGGGGEFHGKGPKSCPALSKGGLFTLSITGVLSAWDANDGRLLWRRDYSAQFEKSHPYWGTSTSPLVDGDRVVVHFGYDKRGMLVALDTHTGEEVWRTGEDPPSYSSPLATEIAGVRQIVEWNQRVLAGIESASGKTLWEVPLPQIGTDQNMPSPIVHHDRVIVGGENRGVFCFNPKLEDGKWTVDKLWSQADVALDMSTAITNGDLLFGFSHYSRGQLFCLDSNSGEVLWRGPGRTGDNAMFLAIPDHVVALLDNGQVKVIRASGDRLDSVAEYRVSEEPTWAPPVLLQEGLLIKDKQTLTFWSFTELP